ncbi:MAG: primosomal protein N', partial [Candidatus Omnitrophota bacterium]
MNARYADIALALPMWGTFQYAIPEGLADSVQIGKRVYVSVRNRRMVGYLVGFSDKPLYQEIKAIESVIDAEPILTDRFLELTRWMSRTYCCG